MNNAFLKTRFRILSALGLVPGSDSIEKKENAIEREYDHLIQIRKSDELARYEELKNYFRSGEFKKKKKEINAQKYKNTEPYRKEKRFNKLRNSEPVKTYLKVSDSKELDHYLRMKDSDRLNRFFELKEFFESGQFEKFKNSLKNKRKEKQKEYKDTLAEYKNLRKSKKSQDSESSGRLNELEKKVNSEEFKQIPEEIRNLEFKNTEEYGKYKEYKRLKKDKDIKKALQFRNSKKFAIYQSAVESEALKEYQDLKDYIESDDFIENKGYLKTRNKFKLSRLYQNLQEYKELKKSENIRWYYKNKDAKRFEFFRRYERTFRDTFEGEGIDPDKWLTSYYWGKALLNESYVQATDAHFITEGSNLEINNGLLRIITRREEVEGKVWHPNFGFYPRKFSYTSGLINTGQSFRQKYGLFRAKVKLSHAPHLRHCFWMVPEKILPEVDVFNFSGEKPREIEFGSYKGNPDNSNGMKLRRASIKGPNFTKRFYIFSLEWKPGILIWKINGITVNKFRFNIPEEPMYMILNSGLNGDINGSHLPKEMQVDWVDAFKKK